MSFLKTWTRTHERLLLCWHIKTCTRICLLLWFFLCVFRFQTIFTVLFASNGNIPNLKQTRWWGTCSLIFCLSRILLEWKKSFPMDIYWEMIEFKLKIIAQNHMNDIGIIYSALIKWIEIFEEKTYDMLLLYVNFFHYINYVFSHMMDEKCEHVKWQAYNLNGYNIVWNPYDVSVIQCNLLE